MERLFAAAGAGNVELVDVLLRELPDVDMGGEVGSALLREAAVAGHAEMFELLLWLDADLNGAWCGDAEPVSWLAERGAWNALLAVLPHSGSPSWWPSSSESSLRAALSLARTWLSADPEQELRRRLAVGDNPATVIERVRVPAWRWGGSAAMRIRVRAADGRRDQVWTGHRAVVTLLEQRLGIVSSNDELVERAMHTADPHSWDYDQAQATITDRADHDGEVFDWLADRLAHPAVEHRLFAAQILHDLSFADRSFDARAADILADRICDEQDPAVLDSLIGAFAEYALRARPGTDLPEVLPHARHRDPLIRARVAMELVVATGSRHNPTLRDPAQPPPPAVLSTLVELAADPDTETRSQALHVLAASYLANAQIQTVLSGHLSDTHLPARIEAAVGLVLRDDPRGRETLHSLQTDPATNDAVRRQLADLDRLMA